jgi:NADPH:quinone reductase-like Zn-dependent oxidoreductase
MKEVGSDVDEVRPGANLAYLPTVHGAVVGHMATRVALDQGAVVASPSRVTGSDVSSLGSEEDVILCKPEHLPCGNLVR